MRIIDDLENIENHEKIPLEDSLYFKFLIAKKHFLTLESVIKIFFPFYTLHDHVHSEAIINNLSAMELPNLITETPLNKYELFLLCSAAYLHDVGMIEEKDEDKKESAESGISVTDIIRNRHHERSYEHIKRFQFRLYLDEFEARNLAIVSKGHRKENLYENPEYKPTIYPADPTYTIRLDLLAALLRIADELDISYKRVEIQIKDILEKYQTFDVITQLHWFKHYYTIGPKFKFVKEKGIIKKAILNIEFQIPNDNYKSSFIIPFVINPIKKEIDFLQKIFYKYGFSLEFGEPEYRIDNELLEIPKELHDEMYKFLINKVNIRVLIVDDEEMGREDLAIIIKNLGYEVDLAKNSKEAIERARKQLYHLILIDLRMPNLQNILNDDAGIELLKHMKYSYNNYPIVYIIITALSTSTELVVDCLQQGAYDFIEKSWPQRKIKAKIQNAIKMNFHVLSEV